MAYKTYQKKELGLGTNAFNKPIEYSGIDAWVKLFVNLLFTIPGTYSSDPKLGVGIQKYRFTFFDQTKPKLEEDINRQTRLYLPDVPIAGITASMETVNGVDILLLRVQFRVSDNDLKTAYVAVDTSVKTLNYEVAF